MKPKKYDFGAWATVYGIKCADGRTLMHNAFIDDDGQTIPVVWGHDHSSPEFVLGNAYLEHRDRGVYSYITFNNTRLGKDAKEIVQHGDVTSVSIYANRLQQDNNRNVSHGMIRELSLVIAGANPGAKIDFSMAHADDLEDGNDVAALIHLTDEDCIELFHEEEEASVEENKEEEQTNKEDSNVNPEEEKAGNAQNESLEHAEGEDKTLQDVYNTLNDEQKKLVQIMVGMAVENAKQNNNTTKEGNDTMRHNAFDNTIENDEGEVLTHDEEMAIFSEAKSKKASLRETTLAHSVTNIGYLFPDHKAVDAEPPMISREMEWVSTFLNNVHRTPFSRIKSIFANITAEEARAKGYLTKGTQKIEEVIVMLKRTTDPTTVYKLQKLDRDDIIDITDYDVVMYIKKEMRVMLNEELARAMLIGDGRSAVAPDKINESNIRPIWTDDDLYTIKAPVVYEVDDTDEVKLNKFIVACLKARKNYKGSGNPYLFTTEDMLTDLLLLNDGIGRPLYDTVEKLATKLRVKAIVTVPVMENKVREGSGTDSGYDFGLLGLIVNPRDYNVGADKGGAVNLFDDFDIDFNKYEYLIETRCSGALVVPYAAIAIENKYEHVSD